MIFQTEIKGGGTQPTGTKNITSNGVHNVAAYEYADVQVPTTAPSRYLQLDVNANGVLTRDQNVSSLINFNGVKDIDSYVLYWAYQNNANITGALDLSSITSLTGIQSLSRAFSGCSGITSVDLSNLTEVTGSYCCDMTFNNCTGIVGALDLSSLTRVETSSCVSMFKICTGITSVDLSSLKTVNSQGCYQMFYGCTGITSIDLSSLKTLWGANACSGMFKECSNITGVINLSSLSGIYGQAGTAGMFMRCTGITGVDLSKLSLIIGINGCQYTFYLSGVSGAVDLSSLTIVSGSGACSSMFYGCSGITSVDLSHVCKLGNSTQLGNMFENCTSLSSLSFPNLAYTSTNINSAFQNMLKGVTGCTVHFPAEWQTDMASYSNITNGMGGTNTTVLFDLPNNTVLDLSKIIYVGGTNALKNLGTNNYYPNITSVDLSGLITISGDYGCSQMFMSCTTITSVDLSSLTDVINYQSCDNMFRGCAALTSVDLSSLANIAAGSACQYMFQNCTSLASLSFPALTSTSFGEYTDQFNNMLQGVTGCTVHFPSNLQSVIGSWNDVTNGFGGKSTTVLWDLPATVTLTCADTKSYKRNPKYDTATALGWYESGTDRFATQYYTSGTTDPAVSDTIYSDSACTTPVTTISSIA